MARLPFDDQKAVTYTLPPTLSNTHPADSFDPGKRPQRSRRSDVRTSAAPRERRLRRRSPVEALDERTAQAVLEREPLPATLLEAAPRERTGSARRAQPSAGQRLRRRGPLRPPPVGRRSRPPPHERGAHDQNHGQEPPVALRSGRRGAPGRRAGRTSLARAARRSPRRRRRARAGGGDPRAAPGPLPRGATATAACEPRSSAAGARSARGQELPCAAESQRSQSSFGMLVALRPPPVGRQSRPPP